MKKITKYALYHTVPVALLFVSLQSKHRNFLFRYRTETTETNVLFRSDSAETSFRLSFFFFIKTGLVGDPRWNTGSEVKEEEGFDHL